MHQNTFWLIDNQKELIFIDDIKIVLIKLSIFVFFRIDVDIQIDTCNLTFPLDRIAIHQYPFVLDQ